MCEQQPCVFGASCRTASCRAASYRNLCESTLRLQRVNLRRKVKSLLSKEEKERVKHTKIRVSTHIQAINAPLSYFQEIVLIANLELRSV